jgi:hypothetical protein
VRLYYCVASTILRVLVHEDCWAQTRPIGIEALRALAHTGSSGSQLARFVGDKRGKQVSDAEFAAVARLCGSPWTGGFRGPNGSLNRTDDPHDQEEPWAPLSTTAVWWNALKSMREVLYEAFSLQALPTPAVPPSATKALYEWCPVVLQLAKYADLARHAPTPGFDPTDWVCANAQVRSWSLVGDDGTVAQPASPEPMRLRWQGERVQYRPLSRLVPGAPREYRNPHFLVRQLTTEGRDLLAVAVAPP